MQKTAEARLFSGTKTSSEHRISGGALVSVKK